MLTLDLGDPINDALTADDATPDNISVTVTNPSTPLTTLSAQPVTNSAFLTGPIGLNWVGTVDTNLASGDYDWTIAIDDGTSITTITARIRINGLVNFTNNSSLALGNVNASYGPVTLIATGGQAPYTYTVVSGALPTGLVLNANTGEITGTPTSSASADFNVQATDSNSVAALKSFQILIGPALIGGGGGGGGGGCIVATGAMALPLLLPLLIAFRRRRHKER